MTVLRILGFRRRVGDLDRALDFYVGALGFEQVDHEGPPSTVRLMLGAQWLELVAVEGMPDLAEASVARGDFQHFALVVEDMASALRRLHHYTPRTITTGEAAIHLPARYGGLLAFKFRDPDGHPLELIQGTPVRIDHSAIAVSDLKRSLAFYVDTLGLQSGARQVNEDAEQALLDGVCQSRVEVLALNPVQNDTPHLELLAYEIPAPAPAVLPKEFRDEVVYLVDDPQARRLHDPDGHAVVLLPA